MVKIGTDEKCVIIPELGEAWIILNDEILLFSPLTSDGKISGDIAPIEELRKEDVQIGVAALESLGYAPDDIGRLFQGIKIY